MVVCMCDKITVRLRVDKKMFLNIFIKPMHRFSVIRNDIT